jgi:hypothetical protein
LFKSPRKEKLNTYAMRTMRGLPGKRCVLRKGIGRFAPFRANIPAFD